MKKKHIFGIDLGTTYSCIAHVDEHGKPIVLPNSEHDLTTPSVVYFDNDTVVVGKSAKDVAAVEPEACVSTVKRVMGDENWEFEFDGKTYKPQDISSFILRKVVADAALTCEEPIEDVVITCPAYFGVKEKEATKQAGILAGLNVLYVIPEPTAAALAYGIEQERDQVVLVYDLGGGTFDVTIIEVKQQEINVICTGGDHQLGGKNWDEAIVAYFASEFEKEHAIPADDLLEDLETYQELLNAAERCKKTLSTRTSVDEPVRFAGKRSKVRLTRETFDTITRAYLERTISLTEGELEKAKEAGFSTIDKILLVGGSTFMPQIIDTVGTHFDCEVAQYDPNQAVAKGAAVFGFKCLLDEQIKEKVAAETGQATEQVDLALGGSTVERAKEEVAMEHGLTLPGLQKIVDKVISNVTSKSFGVRVYDPVRGCQAVANLIHVNDRVPTTASQQFGTQNDGQTQADLVCMENLQDESKGTVSEDLCREVGQAVLDFRKPMKRGAPVEITFDLSADGLLSMKGKDLTGGLEVQAEWLTAAIMNEEELSQAKSRNLAMAVS
ncbi:Hsp70 family protein [Sulfidibacter corallicola]|uniref:Hsp70 family protein n=1 Tax=Sulfidibacter corallicola TaxID=2818388 RepID=A0A8A4TN96_SULCO|nr:Hsp70 family protein [Sulfidibacter corallicola]QTD51459.1 Hsp70 family protein [Sulfidibacter corallicola]